MLRIENASDSKTRSHSVEMKTKVGDEMPGLRVC